MKTASEAEHEYSETAKALADARQVRVREYLGKLPPSDDPKALGFRTALLEGRLVFSRISCKHCGTELAHGGAIQYRYPPKRDHYCPGCGAVCSLPAYLTS